MRRLEGDHRTVFVVEVLFVGWLLNVPATG